MATNKKNVSDAPVAAVAEAPVADAPVKRDRVQPSQVGSTYATLMGVSGSLAGSGLSVKQLVLAQYGGKEMVVAPATKDSAEEVVVIGEETWTQIEASLSKLPQLRAQFQSAVVEMIAKYRETPEWAQAIARYDEALEQVEKIRNDLIDMTYAAAAPFDAGLFVDATAVREVKPRSGMTATPIANGGHRSKAPSNSDFSKGRYEKEHGGTTIVLERQTDGSWSVYDANGNVYSEGERTPQAATKAYLINTGRSPSISVPAFWNAFKEE